MRKAVKEMKKSMTFKNIVSYTLILCLLTVYAPMANAGGNVTGGWATLTGYVARVYYTSYQPPARTIVMISEDPQGKNLIGTIVIKDVQEEVPGYHEKQVASLMVLNSAFATGAKIYAFGVGSRSSDNKIWVQNLITVEAAKR